MFYLSAGVYTNEIDLSQIIPTVASTIGAIVGYSNKGSLVPQLMTNTQQFIQEYGLPSLSLGYFHYSALAFLTQGKQLWCQRVMNGALYGGVAIMQAGSGSNIAMPAGSSLGNFQTLSGHNVLFEIFGADPGAWDNNVSIQIGNVVAATGTTPATFTIYVYFTDSTGNTTLKETWIVTRTQSLDGFGNQQYIETQINGFSNYITVADNLAVGDTILPVVQSTNLYLANGSDGSAISDGLIIQAWQNSFSNPDNIDVRILLNGGYTDVAVQQAIVAIAESRKDCIAILDMPYANLSSTSSIINWRNVTLNVNSSYACLYAPWLNVFDQYNNQLIFLPPSGYIGAVFAYNDSVAQPWYAPAGFNRGLLNVQGVSTVFAQGDRDTLYPNQVNPIQMFRGAGIAVWGQKTLQTQLSALSSINVRRLLIILEKSIAIGLQSFVFEPNSDMTRFRVFSVVNEYLAQLSAGGAFQTELGDRGYQVVCDTTNNTPATIDDNELHVDVYIKPSRAAEYIQLQCIITATGASFAEIIAQGTLT